jgi:hypothetical protein
LFCVQRTQEIGCGGCHGFVRRIGQLFSRWLTIMLLHELECDRVIPRFSLFEFVDALGIRRQAHA